MEGTEFLGGGGGREVDDEQPNREGLRGRAGDRLQIDEEEGEIPGAAVPAEIDEAGSSGGEIPVREITSRVAKFRW